MIRRRLLFVVILAALLAGCVPGQPLFGDSVAPILPATTPTATGVVQQNLPLVSGGAAEGTPTVEQGAQPPATPLPPTPALALTPVTSVITQTETIVVTGTKAPLPTVTAPTAPVTPTAPVSTTAALNVDLSASMTVDPAIRQGVLANGLTYIIRHNPQPQNRAELRLGVNAGSVLEDDDQLGLAHFLEHMLFNGTRRFPEMALVNFLEGIGMRFGPDINAYTSFDETVYELRVPLDDAEVVDTAFDVLVEWAGHATLDPAQIDAERGVVVEEHRLRELNAEGRLRDALLPLLLGGSRYGERLPIGDMDIVRNASPATVRRFYETWYRPDLMAVIAVGDFADMDEVEATIKEKFGALPKPTTPAERPTFNIPDFEGTRYMVATDPENPDTNVQVYFKQDARMGDSYGQYRDALVEMLFFRMLNERYTEIGRRGGAPFAFAGAGPSNIVRTAGANLVVAGMEEEQILPALEALMTEVERVRRFGFTEPELSRARAAVLESYRGLKEERDAHESSTYAEEYLRHFFTGEGIPGIDREYELVQGFLPTITLDEVNAEVKGLLSENNRVVAVTAPEKTGFTPPTQDELATVMAQVATRELIPYAERALDRPLMTTIPEPAAVVSETQIADIGVDEIRLANGVRVLLKSDDFNKEEVIFSGQGAGGVSLVEDADVPEARLISVIVSESGVGEFTRTDLDRLLTGKTLDVSPNLDDLSQSINGFSTMQDMETALQLLNLYFTAPRLDPTAVDNIKTALRTLYRNRELDPQAALEETIGKLLYGDTIRRQPVLPLAEIEKLDADRAFAIYKERFADVTGWTFTFVGNFDRDELLPLIQRYIGTLPAGGRAETWRGDRVAPYRTGVQEAEVRKGNEPRSTVEVIFPGPYEPSPENDMRLALLRRILNIRLREELRENLSGTYAPGVSENVEIVPEPQYLLALNFTTDPARAGELTAAAFAIIKDMQAKNPTDERLNTAKEQERRVWEEEARSNAFWLDTLQSWAFDPAHNDPTEVLRIADTISGVTADDIRRAAQDYLRFEQYIKVILSPSPDQGVTAMAR